MIKSVTFDGQNEVSYTLFRYSDVLLINDFAIYQVTALYHVDALVLYLAYMFMRTLTAVHINYVRLMHQNVNAFLRLSFIKYFHL